MTDEELQQTMQALDETLNNMSKEDTRPRRMLLYKKQVLQKIQTAKAKNDMRQEMKATMDYTMLITFGEKHPYLMMLMRSKFGWTPF